MLLSACCACHPAFSIEAECSGNVDVFRDSFHIIEARLESTT
jgi:hypothetical protein